MKILEFTTKQTAQNLIDECNSNAGFTNKSLTSVIRHSQDENVFWLLREPLEVNAGVGEALNSQLINSGISSSDFIEKEKSAEELISEGYVTNV